MDGKAVFIVGSFVAACSVKVSRLPRPGETLRAESFTLEPGGKGFNVAVTAHRLGAKVDGVFSIGADAFAEFAFKAFDRNGLSTKMLLNNPGSTGAGVGLVDGNGENCIAVCPAANDLLSSDDIRSIEDRIRQAKLVIAQYEILDRPIEDAFEIARSSGASTILNPSPFRAITPQILSLTTLLVVNRTEALEAFAQVTGAHATDGVSDTQIFERLAQSLFARGVETLVITLGADGLMAWTSSGTRRRQDAYPVTVVDTIGAGDACLGGIVAAIAQGENLDNCLRWGAACGALATTQHGLLQTLPTLAELSDLIGSIETSDRSHPC